MRLDEAAYRELWRGLVTYAESMRLVTNFLLLVKPIYMLSLMTIGNRQIQPDSSIGSSAKGKVVCKSLLNFEVKSPDRYRDGRKKENVG